MRLQRKLSSKLKEADIDLQKKRMKRFRNVHEGDEEPFRRIHVERKHTPRRPHYVFIINSERISYVYTKERLFRRQTGNN